MRNPHAIRPWQHVLDSLLGYTLLADKLHAHSSAPGQVNFGPAQEQPLSVREMVELAFEIWPGTWIDGSSEVTRRESNRLMLSSDVARELLGWVPRWQADEAISRSITWYRCVDEGGDPIAITNAQIDDYEAEIR